MREPRHPRSTVNGDRRDANCRQGVAIYVSGHDIGKGDTVGTPLPAGLFSSADAPGNPPL